LAQRCPAYLEQTKSSNENLLVILNLISLLGLISLGIPREACYPQKFVLRCGRDECNRVAGGLSGVVYAVPRAGAGELYTKVTCECAIRWFSDPRGLFSQPLSPLFFQKKVFAGTGRIAVNAGSGR
jgi:hypothetical protein